LVRGSRTLRALSRSFAALSSACRTTCMKVTSSRLSAN
jgi:hypothetical protein